MNSSPQTQSPNYQKWEFFLAYSLIAFTPFMISIKTYDSFLLPKTVWLLFATALWLLLAAYQPGQRNLFRTALNKPLAALFLVSFLSILVQYHSPLQYRALLNQAMFIALFFGFYRFWRLGASPVRVAQVVMIVTCLLSIYGLLQDYGIDFTTTSGGVRDWRAKVIATLGNPNFLAGYLAIALPVVIAYALRLETRFLGFTASCLTVLLIAACHTVTFCVGAAIGLIGALIATLSGAICLQGRIRLPIARTLILVALAVLAIGWYMLENPYNSHGRSLYRQAWESSHWWSGMGARQFNWKTTRIMIDENPLTGIGFGNYLSLHQHYQGLNYKRQWHAHDRDYVVSVDQPHFQLLETAAETGPLGVLALGWLAMAWMKAAGRTLRRSNDTWFAWGCYAGVWEAIVHSFSSFPFHLPANTLLVIVWASYLASVPGSPQYSRIPSAWHIKAGATLSAFLLAFTAFLLFTGNQYLRKGFESDALDSIYYLDRARACDPWSHETYFLLGQQYANQGWNRQALEAFQKALRLQEDIQVRKELVRIYQRMGNREAAIRELERIIEINPVYPGHYRDLIAYLGDSADPEQIAKLNSLAESLEKQMQQNQ